MSGLKPGPRQPIDTMAKFVGGAMGLIFAGIGLTVLVFIWSASFEEFGSPPLFFRVFASFIALAFVIIGGSVFGGTIMGIKAGGKIMQSMESVEQKDSSREVSEASHPTSYTCARCGAPLGEGVEVSLHGDVKCSYCSAWFNIHIK